MRIKTGWRMLIRNSFLFLGIVSFFTLVPAVFAHDFRIERSGKDFLLIFGHGVKAEDFDASKVKSVKAFTPDGREIEVRRERKGKGLLLQPVEPSSWVFAEIDDGYWSKTIYGWKNLPKRKASRVVEANRSFYYSKALMSWSDALQSPLSAAQLDIVLLRNPYELKAGDSLPIRVFYSGKAIAGVEVEGRAHKIISTTDKDGTARVRLTRGQQLISASYKESLKDDPDADSLICTATLTFEVGK